MAEEIMVVEVMVVTPEIFVWTRSRSFWWQKSFRSRWPIWWQSRIFGWGGYGAENWQDKGPSIIMEMDI